MSIIAESKLFDMFTLLAFAAVTIYYLWKLSKNEIPTIRRIPGLDAIEEAIGRAVEMGRPMFFTPFNTPLTTERASQTIAGFSVLEHVARESFKKGSRLIATYNSAEAGPFMDHIIRSAAIAEGEPNIYTQETDLRFLPGSSNNFAIIDLFVKENVGSAVMIGYANYSTLLISQVLLKIGAYTVGGTAHIDMLSFMAGSFDYTLLGEEIYAAGAYLSEDPQMTATIGAQDSNKLIIIAVTVVSFILYNIGFKGILDILAM